MHTSENGNEKSWLLVPSGVRLLVVWESILLNRGITEPQILSPHPPKLRHQINFLECFKAGFFWRCCWNISFLLKKQYRLAGICSSSYHMTEDVAILLVFSATSSLISRDGRCRVLLGDAQWKLSLCHSQFCVQIARSNRALALLFQWAFGIWGNAN